MLFALTNVLLVLLVWRLLPLVAPGGGPWTHLTAAFVLSMAIPTATLLVLGLAHVMNAVTVLAVLVISLGGVLVLERRVGRVEPPPMQPVGSASTTITGSMLGASLGVWFGRPAWTGTGFCFDDITYHAAVPSQWLQWGAIDYVPFTYQSYYSFNAELLSLWFMVPSGDASHAGTAVLMFVGLVVCSTLSMGETHDVPAPVTLSVLAAMFASHKLLYFARTFSSTDLAMTAYVVAALAFALRPPSRRTALWCGLAAGLAVGTKVSAVPPMALVGLWWSWRARRGQFVLPVLFTAGLLAFGSYWYVRNLIHTGNPLFPAELGPFEGPLDPESARRTALIHFITKKGDSWKFWEDLFYDRADWPLFLGAPAVLGYFVAAITGFWKDRRGLWLVAAVGVVFLLLFPFQPFSGTINRPNSSMHGMVRYLTLCFIVGLPLLSGPIRRPGVAATLLTLAGMAGFCGAVYAATDSAYGAADALWLLAGSSVALIVMGLIGGSPGWVAPAFVSTILVLIALRGPQKQEATNQRRSHFSPMGRLHEPAWSFLDTLPEGSGIAWLSDLPPSHAFNLPLFGDHLQFQLVPIDQFAQRVDLPLHKRWRDEPEKWWWQFSIRPGSDVQVMENLLRTGADYLVISRCQKAARGGWPHPHAGLLATDASARLYNDTCSEIWDVEALRGAELKEPARRMQAPRPAPKGKGRGKGKGKGKEKPNDRDKAKTPLSDPVELVR